MKAKINVNFQETVTWATNAIRIRKTLWVQTHVKAGPVTNSQHIPPPPPK
jgi:hypothetical protein